jgi:excisionase family DNA binding protein
MSLAMAAGYLSIDENSFQKIARANDLRPVDLGLELERWRRSDLDRLIAKLPGVERGMGMPAQQAATPSQASLSETDLDRIATRLQARPGAALPQACNIRQAAEALGIGRSTVYRLINDGKLTPKRIAGRVVIRRSEIDRLLDA